VQRILDPAQIEGFAQRSIPRVRLPDLAALFANRASRLRKLAEAHSIGDYLCLMAILCDAQQSALAALSQGPRGQPMQPAPAQGMPLIPARGYQRDPRWRAVLDELCTTVAAAAGFPPAVAETCQQIRAYPMDLLEQQADLLLTPGSEGIDRQAAPFLMAALQVYWTNLVRSLPVDALAAHAERAGLPGVCPVCGTLPVASIVRADKAHMGYRYLHCALCETEWHLVRVKCSNCDSTQGIHYHSIESGSIESGASPLRAESCERCHSYRKIAYQEHDPDIEPVADDLGSLALDLLMAEAGFHRASGHPLLWQAV
jgi:FdhE protein